MQFRAIIIASRYTYAADGDKADYFHRKLLGRVVGILEPDFRIGRVGSSSDV